MFTDPTRLSTPELFAAYVACLSELRARGVTRSTNNPVADYAELLFQEGMALRRTAKSNKGYDAVDEAGVRYEIKARRITAHNGSRQVGALRALDQKSFDFLGGVLFNDDFTVFRACLVPHDTVLNGSRYKAHTNSWIFHLRDSVWERPGVIDVTAKLQQAQKAYG